MKFYTGVGSRNTPSDILAVMTTVANKLSRCGYVLRSGGATGADTAFARGSLQSEIYRPEHATPESLKLAASVHPAWNRCSEYAKKLHARNCFQVLGRNLDTPSDFLLCWTPDGCTGKHNRSISTGGTATAIVLAEQRKIRVYNLKNPEHLKICLNWIK